MTWRIKELLKGSGLRIECVQPVWKDREKRSKFSRFVDLFMPERFSFTPKRPGYFTDKGFKERGLTDFYEMNMEEYLWKGEPFSIHIRNAYRKNIPRLFAKLTEGLQKSATL